MEFANNTFMLNLILDIEGYMTPEQEHFLFHKVKSLPEDAVILEIGAHKGRSTIIMAYACMDTQRKIYTINTWNHLADVFQKNIRESGLGRYIMPLSGHTDEILDNWQDITQEKAIDFVFIDGVRGFLDVLKDYEASYPLLKENGWLALYGIDRISDGPGLVWHKVAKPVLTEHEFSVNIACGQKKEHRITSDESHISSLKENPICPLQPFPNEEERKYIIVSGYYAAENDVRKHNFLDIWCNNTFRYCQPDAAYIINSKGFISENDRNLLTGTYGCKIIDLTYNLGHVNDLINNNSHHLCGWTMSTLIGALLAYSCNCDMIYKEQDCLAFGDWTGKMYERLLLRNVRMLVGRNDTMQIEQSLFIIRNDFLLDYITSMLSISQSDSELLPEFKFSLLKKIVFPGKIDFLDFGYGRNRPVDYDENVFYMQQIADNELKELGNRGLI